jgi:hypothetical protein
MERTQWTIWEADAAIKGLAIFEDSAMNPKNLLEIQVHASMVAARHYPCL